jgi:multidrug resistance efflux pump
MDPLPPIPTPFEQRWREFRIQVLPVIVFLAIVAAVVFLWQGYIQPVGLIGQVEAVKANAASLTDGVLVRLAVDRFDVVTAGQEIAEVVSADAELMKRELASAKSDLKVLQARMQIDDQRREFDYQTLWLDLLEQKMDYAANVAMLTYRSNEFVRISSLQTISSVSELDLAKAEMDSLAASVKEQAQLIGNLGTVVETLRTNNQTTIRNPIDEAILAKENELELIIKPLKIYAPIAGIVSLVYRRQGENVVSGEPLVTITSTSPDHILGYMRQPMDELPELNTPVQVVTQGRRRIKGEGQVIQVGSSFEPIDLSMMSATSTSVVELGLPILISIPTELKSQLRPGQSVGIAFKTARN